MRDCVHVSDTCCKCRSVVMKINLCVIECITASVCLYWLEQQTVSFIQSISGVRNFILLHQLHNVLLCMS